MWHLALLLGLAAASPLAAQVPSSIFFGKFQSVRQTSATDQQFTEAGVFAGVDFRTAPAAGVTIQLRGPNGSTNPLTLDLDGTYTLDLSFRDIAQLQSAFPDGTYSVVVSGGAAPSTTTFTITAGAPPAPVLISNYDALQAWPDDRPVVSWPRIPAAGAGDVLELLFRQDDTIVADSGSSISAATTSLTASRSLPFGTPLTGELDFYHFVTDSSLNNGVTSFVVATGFEVDFPVQCSPNPPAALAGPAWRVGTMGSAIDFTTQVTGVGLSYQLKKNGVPVSGARPQTSSGANNFVTFSIPITQAADAGSYTIEVTNATGRAETGPLVIVVAPKLTLTPYTGTGGAGAVDGPVATARFEQPLGMAFDAAGSLYVADYYAKTIRVISPLGVVSTLAGAADQSGSVDGVGAAARFIAPSAVVVDATGNVYVADSTTVRKIAPGGVVSTLAGLAGAEGAVDGTGSAARFRAVGGIAVDPAGTVYVSDRASYTVRKITPAGVVSTLAGIAGISGSADGVGAAARFTRPNGCFFRAGSLYVADATGVRRVTAAGDVTTVSGLSVDTGNGEGGGATLAVDDLAVDTGGAIWIYSLGAVRRMVVGGSTLTLASTGALGGGVAVDPSGNVYMSQPGGIILRGSFTPGSSDPAIAIGTQPRAQAMAPGASVAFSAQATGPGLSYQWQKNGIGIPNATTAMLMLSHPTTADAANYSVLIGNGVGAVASSVATLSFSATPDLGRIGNLSVLSTAGSGSQALIAGLVIAGGASGATKPLLVRGIGPTLTSFGVGNALADPAITVTNSANVAVGGNDNWGGGATLANAFASVGAFALRADSADAALSSTLAPGGYTIQVSGQNNASGTALIEVYDLSGAAAATSGPRLVNLSARTKVGTGANVLTAGFAIAGATGKTLLIRALGPALTPYGVTGVLTDPLLRIYDGRNALVASNDDIGFGDPLGLQVGRVAFDVGAATVTGGKDSALVVTLPPGAYSAQVSGVGGTTGVALVEIYEVP